MDLRAMPVKARRAPDLSCDLSATRKITSVSQSKRGVLAPSHAIACFWINRKELDTRHKAGHDEIFSLLFRGMDKAPRSSPLLSFRGASTASELWCAIAHLRISRFRACASRIPE